uniref:RNA-dependent RNA polymerase n=1 Tax=Tiger flathead matonavirus FL7 TaxID=2813203 RepID=A0A894JPX7_9VIRU|nr:MAG: RNA-dependent RNA polymerase [Tiger flathead matonavirus FL7]
MPRPLVQSQPVLLLPTMTSRYDQNWLDSQLQYHLDPSTGTSGATNAGRDAATAAVQRLLAVPCSLSDDAFQAIVETYPYAVRGPHAYTPDLVAIELDLLAHGANLPASASPLPGHICYADLTWHELGEHAQLCPLDLVMRRSPTALRFQHEHAHQLATCLVKDGKLTQLPAWGAPWTARDSLPYAASHCLAQRGFQFSVVRTGIMVTHYRVTHNGAVGVVPRPMADHLVPDWSTNNQQYFTVPQSAYAAAATATMALSKADLTAPKVLRTVAACTRRLIIGGKTIVEAANLTVSQTASLAAHMMIVAREAHATVESATATGPPGMMELTYDGAVANPPRQMKATASITRKADARANLVVGIYGDTYRLSPSHTAVCVTTHNRYRDKPTRGDRFKRYVAGLPSPLACARARKWLRRHRNYHRAVVLKWATTRTSWRHTGCHLQCVTTRKVTTHRGHKDKPRRKTPPFDDLAATNLFMPPKRVTFAPQSPPTPRRANSPAPTGQYMPPPTNPEWVDDPPLLIPTPLDAMLPVLAPPPEAQDWVTAPGEPDWLPMPTYPAPRPAVAVPTAPPLPQPAAAPHANLHPTAPPPATMQQPPAPPTPPQASPQQSDSPDYHTPPSVTPPASPQDMEAWDESAPSTPLEVLISDAYDPACGAIPRRGTPLGLCAVHCWRGIPRTAANAWIDDDTLIYDNAAAALDEWPWDAGDVAAALLQATAAPTPDTPVPVTVHYTPGHWQRGRPLNSTPLTMWFPAGKMRGGGVDWRTDLEGWAANVPAVVHGPGTSARQTCEQLVLTTAPPVPVPDADWYNALDWLRANAQDQYGKQALTRASQLRPGRPMRLSHLPGCAGSGKTTYIIKHWDDDDMYVSPLNSLHREFLAASAAKADPRRVKTWMRALANTGGARRIWLDEGYSVGQHYIVLLAALSDAEIVIVGDPYQSTHQDDPTNKAPPSAGPYCTTSRRFGPTIQRLLMAMGNDCVQRAIGPPTVVRLLRGPQPTAAHAMAHTHSLATAQRTHTIRSQQGVTVGATRIVLGAASDLCYSQELNYVACTRARHQVDIHLLTGDTTHEWGSLGHRATIEQVLEPVAPIAAMGRPAPGPPPSDKPHAPPAPWPMSRVAALACEMFCDPGYERAAPPQWPRRYSIKTTTPRAYTRAQILPVATCMRTSTSDTEFELRTAAARYRAHVTGQPSKIAKLARELHTAARLPTITPDLFAAEYQRCARAFCLDHRFNEDRILAWDRVRSFIKQQAKPTTPTLKAGQPIRMHDETLLWSVGLAYRAAERLLLRNLPPTTTYANGMTDREVLDLLSSDFDGRTLCGDYSSFDSRQNNLTAQFESRMLALVFPGTDSFWAPVAALRATARRSLHTAFITSTGASKASGEPGTLLTNTLLNLCLLAYAYPGARVMAKGDDFIIANPTGALSPTPQFTLNDLRFSVAAKWDLTGSFCQFRRGTHGRWTTDCARMFRKLLAHVPGSTQQWRELQTAVQAQATLADPEGDSQLGAASTDILDAAWSLVATRHDKIPLWAVDYDERGNVITAAPATRTELRQQLAAAGQQLLDPKRLWSRGAISAPVRRRRVGVKRSQEQLPSPV